MFLEWWNATKGFSNTSLCEKLIAKMYKKFISQDVLLRTDQDRARKLLPDGLKWLPYLVNSSKSHWDISISCIFLRSSRHKKSYKIFETLFVTFQHSKNILYPHYLIAKGIPYTLFGLELNFGWWKWWNWVSDLALH